VAHLDAREGARVLVAARAPHLDAVAGHALALLLQNRDDIDGRASAQRDEQQLHRRGRAGARRVGVEHLRVPARRGGDEEIVARVQDDRSRVFHPDKTPVE
jgi:hypothetical protein